MDDIDLLKKIYFEKEKENMKLKEELNLFKSKNSKSESEQVVDKVQYTTQPLTCENLDEDPDFFKEKLLNYATNKKISEMNQQRVAEQNLQKNRTEKVLDLGRLYKEGETSKKKRNSISKESLGEIAVKNLENQIGELKNQISSNLDKDYEKISELNKLIYPNQDEKILKLELKIEDLETKLRNKEDEKNQLKEMYEKELRIKGEIYNQNISHLNKTNQEEFRKLRIDYEGKMEELVKKNEEEKFNLSNKISTFEKDFLSSQSRTMLNEKNELIEFQKKYLFEMKDLQKTFEDFKVKTYNQLRQLKLEKEEAINGMNHYKENYNKLLVDFEENETKNKDLIKKLKKKYEESKLTIKNTELLKVKLDETKNEVSFLKLQINKLENSERKLHNLLMEKEKLNENEKQETIQNLHESYRIGIENNLDFKLSSMFSPINQESYRTNVDKTKINIEDYRATNNLQNAYKESLDLDSNFLKIIDLKKAHQKIKEMEENLKSMSNENENLKSQIEMNYESEKVLSTMSKEKIEEYILSRKHQSLKTRHGHNNNSVDLITKFGDTAIEKSLSSNNMPNLTMKSDISKSSLNIHQHLKAKLSNRHTKSSVSPITEANYHSNTQTNVNPIHQVNSSRAGTKRNSISKA